MAERQGAPPFQHSSADERVLALARLVGAAVLLIAATNDPLHPNAVHVLLAAYALHVVVVFFACLWRPEQTLRKVGLIHAVDLSWGVAATTMTGGAASTIFPIFTFVLLGSAFRWGLGATLRDASIVAVATVAESFLAPTAASGQTALNVTAVRIAYIGIGIGLLFGVLLHRQYALRQQTQVLAEIVSNASRATRLEPAVRDTLAQVLFLFKARHLLAVIEDAETGVLKRWRADARSDGSVVVSHLPVPRRDRAAWMFAEPCIGGCELRRPSRDGTVVRVTTAPGRGSRRRRATTTVPTAIASASSWATLTTVPLRVAGVWSGHACLLDPQLSPGGDVRVAFLQRVVQQVVPALVNLHLLGRVRSRAGAVERARISRELHDGPLPTLAGLEMRVEALRQHASVVAPGLAADLRELRDQLHDESVDLRALMQRLRSSDVDARRLQGELADQVARFARATGINAQLEWLANGLELPPRDCTEVVRIVQEALFNVRRHSGANRVWVRGETNGCAWHLIVEDDGHGMGFTGRLTHEQLEASQKGPRVIRERVAALGGALDIDSGPGGTRLAITLPLEHPDHG